MEVIIVGAGQSGIVVAACLSLRGVRSLVLERDDCVGSLWRKRAYDRLRLHLPKKYCALPHLPHPDAAPTYLPRDDFARYLDRYAARFDNDEKFVPEVPGLEAFPGPVVQAAEYRSAEGMRGKAVLVVGCGNSGMEIAYDLASAGAVTSIAVRSEVSTYTVPLARSPIPCHTY
ncbi:hypothetical protein C2845_PM07G06360 [Panicum miliaceum]|uniref:Flavin-containing monooxygenase n=1 Tax=Panicum miliaceum TaxID=4540 RepID=A0A3L6SJP2_PANMI|nr:hypothetical protein C2845_PM07G06360 [Panicum miliaceum]